MTRRRRLRTRDRRALVIGLIVLTPAAAYRIGLAPWLEYRTGLSEALAVERDLYARERGAIQEAAGQPERGAQLQAALDAARPWLLDASSEIAAAGALSRYVTTVGRDSNILVRGIETLDQDGQPTRLKISSIRVDALGDLEGLLRLLHQLESGALLLHVDDLTLRPAGVNDGDLERGQLMAASVVINGFWIEDSEPGLQATAVSDES